MVSIIEIVHSWYGVFIIEPVQAWYGVFIIELVHNLYGFFIERKFKQWGSKIKQSPLTSTAI